MQIMSTYTEEVAERLNGIIEKSIDAQKGFSKAAENAKHSGLRNFFETKAEERENFTSQLKSLVAVTGEEAESSGSLTGKAHRTWMDTKAFFTSDNDESMLEEAIKGEKAALEEYQDVLGKSMPQGAKTVLQQQCSMIENGLGRIRTLEDIVD